jgi:hypothetical protein
VRRGLRADPQWGEVPAASWSPSPAPSSLMRRSANFFSPHRQLKCRATSSSDAAA